MTGITPCLWFDRAAEEAARFYTGLFPDSAVGRVLHYGEGAPVPAGTVMLVEFTLLGRPFQAMNAGPERPFTEAVSLSVDVADQAELDRLWAALTADGGREKPCGWCEDRWGLSWQLIPQRFIALQRSGDPAAAARMFRAMLTMTRLDMAALEAAYAGEAG